MATRLRPYWNKNNRNNTTFLDIFCTIQLTGTNCRFLWRPLYRNVCKFEIYRNVVLNCTLTRNRRCISLSSLVFLSRKLQPYQIFHDILCDEWNQTIQNKVLVAHIFKMSKMIFSAFWLFTSSNDDRWTVQRVART